MPLMSADSFCTLPKGKSMSLATGGTLPGEIPVIVIEQWDSILKIGSFFRELLPIFFDVFGDSILLNYF